jgi:hypothetical protein
LAAALLAVSVAAPGPARAGILDFLFGGSEPQTPVPAAVNSYAEPSMPALPPVSLSPTPGGPESMRRGDTDSGSVVAYCVRLCDGQNFPLAHLTNATPLESCRAMCPASKTKIFFGNGIDRAVARDGARYADLDNAFVYRQHLVTHCTCNGRDAFGLAPFNLANDPTLRPGDIISTKNGFVTYRGGSGRTALFTPVAAGALVAELNGFSGGGVNRRNEPMPVADDPGTIVHSQIGQSESVTPVADLRSQPAR